MPKPRTHKPTVYLDTNIVSVLCYRGWSVSTAHQHLLTREWWDLERDRYDLRASRFTESELRAGEFDAQSEALAVVRRLRYLPFTSKVRSCGRQLLEAGLVPAGKTGDALQLAFATIHRMDYLLTWNYAHLANPNVQRRLTELCQRHDWRPPLLVSPETIPWAVYGQSIRRLDDA